jgi:hypothetical protein
MSSRFEVNKANILLVSKFFIASVLTLLLAACGNPYDDVLNEFEKLTKEKNIVMTDYVASLQDKKKFIFFYDLKDYVELENFNNVCNDFYESSPPEYKLVLRVIAESEVRGIALDEMTSIMEKLSSGDLSRYTDYLSKAANFFVVPSYMTQEYLKNYSPLEGYGDSEMAKITRGNKDEFVPYLTGLFETKDEQKAAVLCYITMPLLGIVGFQNPMQATFERMAKTISKKNISGITDMFNEL